MNVSKSLGSSKLRESLPKVLIDRYGRQWSHEFGALYAIKAPRLWVLRHIDDITRSGR